MCVSHWRPGKIGPHSITRPNPKEKYGYMLHGLTRFLKWFIYLFCFQLFVNIFRTFTLFSSLILHQEFVYYLPFLKSFYLCFILFVLKGKYIQYYLVYLLFLAFKNKKTNTILILPLKYIMMVISFTAHLKQSRFYSSSMRSNPNLIDSNPFAKSTYDLSGTTRFWNYF